jgi:hypothetical protein
VSLPAARYKGAREEAAFFASLQQTPADRTALGPATNSVIDELPLTGQRWWQPRGYFSIGTPADSEGGRPIRYADD